MIALAPFWRPTATHWFGDFVLQTNCQATKKSKRLDALSLHVATYMPTLFRRSRNLVRLGAAIVFTVLNGGFHFATDYFTSHVSSKLRATQDWYLFFVIIGFDQFIHQVTLATTLWVLLA
jgi:hypothetical protein